MDHNNYSTEPAPQRPDAGDHRDPLLELRNVSKEYPVSGNHLLPGRPRVHAVQDVSFKVFPGETLGLVGESGSGKSTLGRQIVGLERPSSGEIIYRGRDLAQMKPRDLIPVRTELQMVFQDPNSSLNPRKPVNDILADPLRYHQIVPNNEVNKEVQRLLELVGLPRSSVTRYPFEFSGGQRQRLGIAKALSLRPKLIIQDEPVSALDVSIQAQILNLLLDIQQEFGLTYIFIAHGLPAVRYVSDRIAVMYLGHIVECADNEVIFSEPWHPYTQALARAIPPPDPTLRNEARPLRGELPSNVNLPTGCPFHTRCPWAEPICREINPPFESLNIPGTEGHQVACHVAKRELEAGRELPDLTYKEGTNS